MAGGTRTVTDQAEPTWQALLAEAKALGLTVDEVRAVIHDMAELNKNGGERK